MGMGEFLGRCAPPRAEHQSWTKKYSREETMRKTHAILCAALCGTLFVACRGDRPTMSNGETIYRTGRDSSGAVISSDVERDMLRDPKRVIACADCHGADRKGKNSGIPDFGPYTAPAVTPEALRAAGPRRPAYDAATLRAAIVEGRNSAGRGLHFPMPRWDLDGKNADDLVRYLLNGK
jgi:hypothetical protein